MGFPTVCARKLWSAISHAPIEVFSVQDLGISKLQFLRENIPVFHTLPYDFYDMRRDQIEWLIQRIPIQREEFDRSEELWQNYFLGKVEMREIRPFYNQLSPEDQRAFDKIAPYRRRAVSRFEVVPSAKGMQITRKTMDTFTQKYIGEKDFRKLPRIFTQLSEKAASLPTFLQTLGGVAQKLLKNQPPAASLEVTVHHTKVFSHPQQVRGNSPEGIHQDGYPFLVTALVVERKKMEGAESTIYDDTKVTEIFKTTLRAGQGILQPDADTKLWHIVSVIKPVTSGNAWRSSIGFDIEIKGGR